MSLVVSAVWSSLINLLIARATVCSLAWAWASLREVLAHWLKFFCFMLFFAFHKFFDIAVFVFLEFAFVVELLWYVVAVFVNKSHSFGCGVVPDQFELVVVLLCKSFKSFGCLFENLAFNVFVKWLFFGDFNDFFLLILAGVYWLPPYVLIICQFKRFFKPFFSGLFLFLWSFPQFCGKVGGSPLLFLNCWGCGKLKNALFLGRFFKFDVEVFGVFG